MKILLVIDTIDKSYGGPARSVPNLALGLSQHGVEVTLLCRKSDNMNSHCLTGSSVKLVVLPSCPSRKEIQTAVLAEHPDIIHNQNFWLPFYHYVARVALRYNIPFISMPRGCMEPWCMKKKWLKKSLAMLLYQKRDLQQSKCVLATSAMEAGHIRDLGVKTPIAVIPNGINVNDYACRTKEDFDKIQKQIVAISRVDEKKGFDYLIQAWSQLHMRFPDWKVRIIGAGVECYVNRLNALINKNQLENCIEILPPVYGRAKREMYISSSLCVLPSHSENYGMTIAEAMACGVPVITTVKTPWSVLNECNMGWCIELSDGALVNAIAEALGVGAKALFDKGQKCSEFIFSNHQLFQVAERNIMMYNWLLGLGQKPEFVQFV